jgi:hypothetical protein
LAPVKNLKEIGSPFNFRKLKKLDIASLRLVEHPNPLKKKKKHEWDDEFTVILI